ncbi:MAG: hypothetical protein GC200_04135 [Tepidisphaera sp.]|nr:hypothetical protein [Tepidisphaera sp.]
MRTRPLAPSMLVLAAGLVLCVAAPGALAQRANAGDKAAQPADNPKAFTREQLDIKRITLYRSGVAAFERHGLISGNARIQLQFDTDQINDILKSMFVLDLSKGQGRIDNVSYAPREPLAKRLSSFGVDLSDDPALPTLLGRLRGARVKIALPDGTIEGTILGQETREVAGATRERPVERVPFLNVVTASGIRSIDLRTTTSISLLDATLNEELNKALAAMAEHRADRVKTVDVNVSGEGARDIVVGYVQESPVWKTSYRLVLGDEAATQAAASKDAKDRFTMQGWAIVENTSDEDWRDVTLALVSGRPVSFRMDLYEPLYVSRPDVPVPTVPGVAPKTYAASTGGSGSSPFRDSNADYYQLAPSALAPAAGKAVAGGGGEQDGRRRGFEARFPASANIADYSPASQATAGEVGEVFQFEIDHPVTIERQRSAMLPIINSGVDGRRVSIFTAADNPDHPLRGVEFTNTTGSQLIPGPIAVYDSGAYAGDAVINHVPEGDKRLVSYAVDLDVDVTHTSDADRQVRKVRIAKGLLVTTFTSKSSQTFTFTNKDTKRGRTIVLEFPKSPGWDLEGQPAASETKDSYRFELQADAGKNVGKTIAQSRTDSTQVALVQADARVLAQYVSGGQASKAVLDAYTQAAAKQATIDDLGRKISGLESDRSDIDRDQSRIRQNMNGSIDRQSDLYSRYMKKLGEQETQLEKIQQQLEQAKTDKAKAETELSEYIAGLDVE